MEERQHSKIFTETSANTLGSFIIMHAKLSEKVKFVTPWYADVHTMYLYQKVRIVSFLENSA